MAQQLKSDGFCAAGLMFIGRDVTTIEHQPLDSKFRNQNEKENQSADQSLFHVVVVFLSALPFLGEILRVIKKKLSHFTHLDFLLELVQDWRSFCGRVFENC